MNNLPGAPDSHGSPEPVDRLNAVFDRLERRIRALEERIAVLEHLDRVAKTPAAAASPTAASRAAASPLLPEIPQWQAGGIFPVLGRAMLGIAGAYLLRALAASRVFPEGPLAFVAIAYALAWMATGARARAAFAAAVYACTSVLILAPMLWELTLHFKGLPAGADAFTLAVLVLVAFALARGPERAMVLRIANVSAAALSLALAVATHANLPFLAVLLMTAGLCEFAALSGDAPCARPLIALAADAGVWMTIYLYRGPQGAGAGYPALGAGWLIAPGFLLFAVFAAGLAIRNGRSRQRGAPRIALFDALQVTIAFLLAACGLLYFGPAAKEILLGLLMVALAAILYASEFQFHQDRRNSIILGAWSAALLLGGIWFTMPGAVRSTCLAAAAVAATGAGAKLQRASLAWHGTVFLLVSVWISGLLVYALHALAGTPADAPSLNIFLTAISALLCYGLVVLVGRVEEPGERQAFPVLFASVSALAAAAMLAQGAARIAASAFEVGPHHLALIRSLILCAAALALAFGGARGRRPELTQIGYAVVLLEAVKLVAEDLRHGHLAYVAASVCLFAVTLIAIPRLTRAANPRATHGTRS